MRVCVSPYHKITISPFCTISEDGYSYGVDIWAFGLLLAECHVGSYPYPREVVEKTFEYWDTVCQHGLVRRRAFCLSL